MTPLCPSHALPEGACRGFTLAGQALLAARRGGRVYVYRNRCPHRGIRLEWEPDAFLAPGGGLLQCSHHAALFVIESGECIQGPCSGDWLDSFSCREADGEILVDLSDT
ncbi:MAG: hypothetical protein GAK43_02610 [Stenotrophomonas maltophilia]|nr:MAG: hypothetical protein GAK43_02610 [Stenotrophomonas maltophilia]